MDIQDAKEGTASVSVDHDRLQAYHTQLWFELRDLLHMYASLCEHHKEQTEAAVARATLFLFFGAMETSIRVLASECLMVSESFSERARGEPDEEGEIAPELAKYLSSEPVKALTRSEELFIREEEVMIGTKDFKEQIRPRFGSFEARLVGVPTIYGRLFGIELQIDKSTREWQLLQRLKTLRDIGAHGNLQKAAGETGLVTREDLTNLLFARKWFCQQLYVLPWLARAEAEGEVKAIDSLLPLLQSRSLQ